MVSFTVSEAANNKAVTPDEATTLVAQFGGFAADLTQRNRVAPLDGMGRTHRVRQRDGRWKDNNGFDCPAPGQKTYNTGLGHAQMNCGMD